MNHFLPMGVSSRDISGPNEICARCGREILPHESHVLLADVPLISALVCTDCSEIDPEESEPEPSSLAMALICLWSKFRI